MLKKSFIPLILVICFVVFHPSEGHSATDDSISQYMHASELESSGKYLKAAEIISEMLAREKSVHLYLKLAELYMVAGDNAHAFSTLQEGEKAFSGNVDIKFYLAQLYEFYKQDPKTALKYYDEASKISNDPKYPLASVHVMESVGDYKSALKIMDKIIVKYGGTAEYYADRGGIYQKLGQKDKSIQDLKKSISIDPNLPAMLRLADIYLSNKDNASAKKILEKVAAQKGDLILPELKLGDIYRNDKEYSKAIELYSEVADKLDGKYRAMVLKQLGALQYQIGDIDNATRSFRWITELTPDDPSGAYLYGYVLEIQKRYSEAEKVYEKALKTSPNYAQLLKRMAAINLMQNKPKDAQKYLKNIDSVEYDVDYYLLLSESYDMLKDHNKAALILIDALNANPTDTMVLYSLATQYEYLKERNKAVEIMKKALAISPKNPILENFLGYLYADMGIKLDEAQMLLESALKQDPNNAAYMDSLGWVFFKQKKYKKAKEYIEKAYKLLPKDPDVKEHMKAIKKIR